MRAYARTAASTASMCFRSESDSVHSHTSCHASSRVAMNGSVLTACDSAALQVGMDCGHTRSGVRKPTKIMKEGWALIGILIAVLFAALVYALCLALGLPAIVGLIAAILVLLAGIPTGGYGLGRRF